MKIFNTKQQMFEELSDYEEEEKEVREIIK